MLIRMDEISLTWPLWKRIALFVIVIVGIPVAISALSLLK